MSSSRILRGHAQLASRCGLPDVGGTLWPNDLPVFAGPDPRLAPLRVALPDLDASGTLELLNAALRDEDGSAIQDMHSIIATALRRMGAHSADAVAVRRALCVPASAGVADVSLRIRPAGAVASARVAHGDPQQRADARRHGVPRRFRVLRRWSPGGCGGDFARGRLPQAAPRDV